jgi:hypothetical protein
MQSINEQYLRLHLNQARRTDSNVRAARIRSQQEQVRHSRPARTTVPSRPRSARIRRAVTRAAEGVKSVLSSVERRDVQRER